MAAAIDIGNRVNWDMPPLSVQMAQHFLTSREKRGGIEWWVIDDESPVVGSAVVWELWEVDPPGTWMLSLEVDDGHCNRGAGRVLYGCIEKRVPEIGVRRILTQVREDRPDGLQFAELHGFARTGHVDRFSRLDVRAVRLDVFEDAEGSLALEGIRIASLAELGANDRMLRAAHALNERTKRDIPMEIRLIDRPYDDWLEVVRDSPDASFDAFWVALDGDRPIGMTRLNLEAGEYTRNAFTGVDREYRGKGIALALKLQTIRWARRTGKLYIFTDNAAENHAMLAINRRLGYEQLPGTIEFAREW
ncbi:MAG: GNAT family N-acetyltransferase [Chloroflexota bacterium]